MTATTRHTGKDAAIERLRRLLVERDAALAERDTRLAERDAQQAATAEVLRVIASNPEDP